MATVLLECGLSGGGVSFCVLVSLLVVFRVFSVGVLGCLVGFPTGVRISPQATMLISQDEVL